ncbi:hypothetical protein [Sandarakinorhabdus cyanobacteriorum]|uniref:hypothetical protein n=1 Tax=Sandarakinorhabdus cyanobacteriorum TaxID=1981098 RepID=UPI0013FD20A0|nr:hypothetical protein [Sandarakinorhabdus cyanobacteriorum]
MLGTQSKHGKAEVGTIMLLLAILISSLTCGFIGSFIARNKGVRESTGFLFGFFLGPIGLVVVALLNSENSGRIPVSAIFDGNRDLSNERYKLWLAQKYNIIKNDILDRYVVGGESFSSLEQGLGYADQLENIQYEKRKIQENGVKFNKKLFIYFTIICITGATILFVRKRVIDYIDHREAISVADEAVAARRRQISSALASANLPLIPSAEMTDVDYKNHMSTSDLKDLNFLTSVVTSPDGKFGDKCSISVADSYSTDYSGKSIWFGSSESPDKVREFYENQLKKAGFTRASRFHVDDEDRIEYANKEYVVFLTSSLIEGRTNVGICVLGRQIMEDSLKNKQIYEAKMAKIEANYNATQRRIERQLRSYGLGY